MEILKKSLDYRFNLIKENMDLPLNGSVLDIGCGTGEITKELSKEVTGADIKNFLKVKINFIKIKNNKIPIKDKNFDYVTFIDSLHHMKKEEQENILREAKRLAKIEVILFENKPTLRAYIADWLLNRLRYGLKMPIPLNFRNPYNWGGIYKK